MKFTFKTTPALAGAVDIGSDADGSAKNLVAAVNGAAGAGSDYIALSADDRAALSGVTATDGTDLVTFSSKRGALMASSAMTNASNDFQAQAINAAIMEKGAIKMALRDSVRIKEVEQASNLVTNYLVWSRYGLKTTTRGAEKIVRISIQSAAAES